MAFRGNPEEHLVTAAKIWAVSKFSADAVRPRAERVAQIASKMKRITILSAFAGIALSYYFISTTNVPLSFSNLIDYAALISPLIIPIISLLAQLKIQEEANYFNNHLAHLEKTAEDARDYAIIVQKKIFPEKYSD